MSGPPSSANLARRLALPHLIIPSYSPLAESESNEDDSTGTIHYRPVQGIKAPASLTKPPQSRPSMLSINAWTASLDRDMMEDIPLTPLEPTCIYPDPVMHPRYRFHEHEEAPRPDRVKLNARWSRRHPKFFLALMWGILLGIAVLVGALSIKFGGKATEREPSSN